MLVCVCFSTIFKSYCSNFSQYFFLLIGAFQPSVHLEEYFISYFLIIFFCFWMYILPNLNQSTLDDMHLYRFRNIFITKRLFSWLAIISRWGPYLAGDVPDVINLHSMPLISVINETESDGMYHQLSTALINSLLSIARKIYTCI